MPHATKSFVDHEHDLWWFAAPAQLEQFLPDMASISMNDGLRNAAEQFTNHVCLVLLRHGIKGLLDHVASECIHAEGENVTTSGIGNCHDLLRSAVFEAALD